VAVQLAGLTRRIGVTVVGLAAAGALVAGCSSSGGGKPSFGSTGAGSTGAGGGTSSSAPAGGGSSTSGGGGGGGANPFCTSFDNSNLSGINSADTAAAALKAWDEYAKNAPSEIKKNVQNIDKYLHDLVNKDYTAISGEASQIGIDGQAIATYFASHCHG